MGLPNEIQVGRYNRLVQKLLSIKGTATTFLASPEVDFVLPLFHGAENRYLEGWDLFGLRKLLTSPGAGNFATYTLRNPINSNVAAVLTRASFDTEPTTGSVILTLFRAGTAGASAGDENNVNASQAFDSRGRSSSTCVISNNTAAAIVRVGGIQVSGQNNLPVLQNFELLRPGEEVPLMPGSLVTMSAAVVNEALDMTFWWRERFLEDSERA